jgi:hypothetical protein
LVDEAAFERSVGARRLGRFGFSSVWYPAVVRDAIAARTSSHWLT